MQGEVLGDSEVKPGELRELENHLNRPEVQQALKSGQGDAIRYSSTLQTPMLYVAFPFPPPGEEGILRLALPLAALKKAEASLHAILAASLALAALISLLLSYLLSHVISSSLRTMAAVAAQLGKGEFGRRIPLKSRDELGELATVMNDMAVRIEGQLASLSAEKNRLNTILRGMGEGLIVCDARGVITLVNPAFHALFSVKEEVEGRPLIEISRHPALHRAFQQVIVSKNERFEEITLTLAEEKSVLTHWVPLLAKGEIQGVVAVFHDITDLKRLERVRRDFVANVSHELRTPVTVIKGYAETLLTGVLNEDPGQARRFVEIINSHSARMTNLVNDLLALSELESGGIALQLGPISLNGTFRTAQRLLESKAHHKGITISLASDAEQQRVLADQGKLEQVLINLVDNAIKYTPAHGSIAISAVDAGNLLKISVTDSGIGIPPKDLPRIFERFYRVDEARSRELGGTGLGLAIVKHIVQLHGGSISVESTPGKGSTFSFTLTKA